MAPARNRGSIAFCKLMRPRYKSAKANSIDSKAIAPPGANNSHGCRLLDILAVLFSTVATVAH